MSNSSTFRFIPNIWISFVFQGNECIGRTCVIEGTNVIALVTEHGKIGHIPFEYAQDPYQIDFTNQKEDEDDVLDDDEYYFDINMDFAEKLMDCFDDLVASTPMFHNIPMN